jgi:hypothetical protein
LRLDRFLDRHQLAVVGAGDPDVAAVGELQKLPWPIVDHNEVTSPLRRNPGTLPSAPEAAQGEVQPAGFSPAALIRRTSTVTELFRYDTLARTIARSTRTRRQRKRVPGTDFLTIDDLHLGRTSHLERR